MGSRPGSATRKRAEPILRGAAGPRGSSARAAAARRGGGGAGGSSSVPRADTRPLRPRGRSSPGPADPAPDLVRRGLVRDQPEARGERPGAQAGPGARQLPDGLGHAPQAPPGHGPPRPGPPGGRRGGRDLRRGPRGLGRRPARWEEGHRGHRRGGPGGAGDRAGPDGPDPRRLWPRHHRVHQGRRWSRARWF